VRDVGIPSAHYFLTNLNRYFRHILDTVSAPPFYTKWVKLPAIDDPVLSHILNNPKWFPFFENAIGAMDGTHINCCPSAADRAASRNRKGGISMNTICSCSFSMQFQHITSSAWLPPCHYGLPNTPAAALNAMPISKQGVCREEL
jgi:hypothetical protein